MRCILFIVPAEYEALKAKGVHEMILERDEGGFFEKVITVHPFCRTTRVIHLNERFDIYEIGFDLFPFFRDSRWGKLLQAPVHFFRVIMTILGAISRHHVSLIRANDPYWMGLFARLASRVASIPYCVSIHADYDKRVDLDPSAISMAKLLGSYRLGRWLEKSAYRDATLVMPIRESLGAKAVEHGADARKIRVIPHGIEFSSFNSPMKHDIRQLFGLPEKFILSFVGRLSRENYVDDMLELARRLASVRRDFIIVMVGGGKEEPRLKALVQNDPVLATVIKLVGFQDRDVCLDLRRVSAVSLCLMGGFSLIEACAAGRPVVAYDVEWHKELVEEGKTGFLLAEGDMAALTDAVCRLLDDPAQAERMGAAARKWVVACHDLAETSKIKIKAYGEILGAE